MGYLSELEFLDWRKLSFSFNQALLDAWLANIGFNALTHIHPEEKKLKIKV